MITIVIPAWLVYLFLALTGVKSVLEIVNWYLGDRLEKMKKETRKVKSGFQQRLEQALEEQRKHREQINNK